MVEPPPTRKFKSLLPLALAIKNSKNKNSRKIVKRENKGNKIFCLVIVNSSTLEYGNVINVTLGGSRHRELKFASDRSALKMDLDSARSHSSKRLQRSAASGKHESIHNRAPSLLSSHCWDSHVLFLVTLFLYLFFGASSARAQALTQGLHMIHCLMLKTAQFYVFGQHEFELLRTRNASARIRYISFHRLLTCSRAALTLERWSWVPVSPRCMFEAVVYL